MFLLSVFVLAQFLLSREISGKDEVLNRLNSQINELTQLLSLERSNSQDSQDQLANLQASLEAAESERTRLEQLLAKGRRLGRRCNHAHRRVVERSRQRARRQPARAVAGRAAQPADRGAAQADRRAGRRARRFGNARPRIQHQDRRSRPPPERRAGAARAGAQPLPLGFLRAAARNPVRSRKHPHRRRPLRVPVGGAVPVGRRGDQRRRPGRDEEACRRHHRAAEGDPAGDQLGAARRRPHRQQAAVRAPAATATIGSCPRRARPRS